MKAPEGEKGRERQGVHPITQPKCLSMAPVVVQVTRLSSRVFIGDMHAPGRTAAKATSAQHIDTCSPYSLAGLTQDDNGMAGRHRRAKEEYKNGLTKP